MPLIQIAHKPCECIGCGLCTEVAPGYWRMDQHGEAQLIQVIRHHAQFEYGHGFEDDRAVLEQAASGCPVGIIRLG